MSVAALSHESSPLLQRFERMRSAALPYLGPVLAHHCAANLSQGWHDEEREIDELVVSAAHSIRHARELFGVDVRGRAVVDAATAMAEAWEGQP